MSTQIAETIRDQIGSGSFYMMGAKHLIGDEKEGSLTFKLGGGARHPEGGKATHVKVTLDRAADLYTVEIIRVNVRAKEMVKVLESTEGVYFDMLHDVISAGTGFALSL